MQTLKRKHESDLKELANTLDSEKAKIIKHELALNELEKCLADEKGKISSLQKKGLYSIITITFTLLVISGSVKRIGQSISNILQNINIKQRLVAIYYWLNDWCNVDKVKSWLYYNILF